MVSEGAQLVTAHRIILTGAVALLSILTCIRIRHDASVAEFYANKVYELDKEFELQLDDKSYKQWHLRHIGFVILLSAAAVATVWISIPALRRSP